MPPHPQGILWKKGAERMKELEDGKMLCEMTSGCGLAIALLTAPVLTWTRSCVARSSQVPPQMIGEHPKPQAWERIFSV